MKNISSIVLVAAGLTFADGSAYAQVKAKTVSVPAATAASTPCDTQAQTAIVANALANKDTKAAVDACTGQLETILAKIVPSSPTTAKSLVKAYERDTLFSAVTFTNGTTKVVEMHRLRVFKKDGTQQEYKYGSKVTADKAWSEWQKQYLDATNCEEDAERVVQETKLLAPGFGRVECGRAYGRAAARYNPAVSTKGNGVVEWNNAYFNTRHLAAASTVSGVWTVFDGPKEAYKATIRKVRVSTAWDSAKTTWEVAYGRKADADTALSQLGAAMALQETSSPTPTVIVRDTKPVR